MLDPLNLYTITISWYAIGVIMLTIISFYDRSEYNGSGNYLSYDYTIADLLFWPFTAVRWLYIAYNRREK